MSFIEQFKETYKSVPTPELFSLWTSLSVLAAAVERKVFVTSTLGTTFPNMYVFLIAPPGVGKTLMTSRAWKLVKKLGNHHVSSSSITRATMIAELDSASRVEQTANGVLSFNCLYVCVDELGVLLPDYDRDMMNKFTGIYEGHPYSESRRAKDHSVSIKSPLFNILAAGTPGYLSTILPEVAWEMGFMSRVILVYSSEVIRKSIFSTIGPEPESESELLQTLKAKANLSGPMKFTPDAAAALDAFFMSEGRKTEPRHPKLQHYATRRGTHMMKLMMLASIAESDDLVIRFEHYHKALIWLTDTEAAMPEVFKAMQTSGDVQIAREVWHFIYTECAKRKVAHIPQHEVIAFLAERVDAQKVDWILKVMLNGQALRTVATSSGPCLAAKGTPK